MKCSAGRSQKGEKDNREGGEGAGMSDFQLTCQPGGNPLLVILFAQFCRPHPHDLF